MIPVMRLTGLSAPAKGRANFAQRPDTCIPVMLAAAEEPMTEVQENMWVTNAKAAR